jgi:murein endopeptidase
VGFKAYKTVETEYGYRSTIDFVIALGKEWAARHPKPRLLIGDLAVQGGGLTPKRWGHPEGGFHKSHGSGLDFDVQIIRTNDVEKAREVSITGPRYDRVRTQELVNLVVETAGTKRFDLIITADDRIKAPKRIHDAGHVFHVHFRLTQ